MSDAFTHHFEVGYDRQGAWVGVALHCLLCPPDKVGPHWVDEDFIVDKTLAEVVAMADRHFSAVHQSVDAEE